MTILLFVTLSLLAGFAVFAVLNAGREARTREAGGWGRGPVNLLELLDELPPAWLFGLSAVMIVWIVAWLVALAVGLVFLSS